MSPSIPQPARPAPRAARNTFQQAAATMATAESGNTAPAAAEPLAATENSPAEKASAETVKTPEPKAVAPTRPRNRQADVAQPAEPPKRNKRITRVPTTDVLLTLPEELKDRMVNVQAHTQARTGITSQQAFIRHAISQLCARYEEQYNQGSEFEPVPEPIDV